MGIRFGVIGLGKMGLLHTAIFNALDGSVVSAVAEPARLPRSAVKHFLSSTQTFKDCGELLKSSVVDAVVITTPVSTHIEIATECVKLGVPFFMEKPLARSVAEAKPLVQELAKHPTIHMIGFMTRFVDTFAKVKEILESDALGEIMRVEVGIHVGQVFTKGKGWRYDPDISGGGVLLSQGSHLIDLLLWYFGKVAAVNARVTSLYSEKIEDSAHLMLEFESGLTAWVDCCWSRRFKRTVETSIEIQGGNGLIIVSDDTLEFYLDKEVKNYSAGWTRQTAVDLYRGVEVDIGGPQYTREDLHFLNALKNNQLATPGIEEALRVQSTIDAAYKSARRRGAPEEVLSNT